MSELTPEQQLEQTRAELARLRAGLAAGLTPEQSERLRGTTPEELAADARALALAFGASTARPPSGSGSDVNPGGNLDAGAQRYKAKHGEGQKIQHAAYTMEK